MTTDKPRGAGETGTPMERPAPLDLGALKGLAHPLRVAIVDSLSAYGPATASALAERLGESSGATSYHLRQLEKHGFVREDTSRGTARERWWERTPRPISIQFDEDDEPALREAQEVIIGEWQRTRARRLGDYLARGTTDLEPEWVDSGASTTSNLPLTLEQSAELIEELALVLHRFEERYRGQRKAGARPFQIHLDVFPLMDGEVQREDAESPAATPSDHPVPPSEDAADVGGSEQTDQGENR